MNFILGIGVLALTVLVAGCVTPQQAVKASFKVGSECVVKRSGPTHSTQESSGVILGLGSVLGSRSGSRTRSTNDHYNQLEDGDDPSAVTGVGVDLFSILRSTGTSDIASLSLATLANGPLLGSAYSMNCVPVHGWVRGGWPMVVDYAPDSAAVTSIEVHVEGQDQPLVYHLDALSGRRLLQFNLPDDLGDSLRSALVLVRSRPLMGAPTKPKGVRLFGLGAGPRAVGSVSIQQVEFQPPLVKYSAQQQASFSFFSKSDFNHLSVGVLRVDNIEGEVQVALAREFLFEGGISRNTWFGRMNPRTWDGTNAQNRVSFGNHLLQVRAWMSASDSGDWVTAWSELTVQVVD